MTKAEIEKRIEELKEDIRKIEMGGFPIEQRLHYIEQKESELTLLRQQLAELTEVNNQE